MALPALPELETRPTATMTFTVKVEGEALPGTLRVVSIDITRELNRIPAAALVLYDGDAAEQDWEASNDELLAPGKAIEIAGGYASDEKMLFKGIITGQRIQMRGRGDSLLHVAARDAAFRMTLNRRSRYFTELTDADLFEQIIGDYAGVQAEVAPTSTTYPEIVQYQVSDWDFIVTRAEAAGMVCLADNGTLRIFKPDVTQEPAAVLAFGRNVFDLDLALDARTQLQSAKAEAWDPANQELIAAEVDDVDSPGQGNLDGPDLAEALAPGAGTAELEHGGSLPQPVVDAWAEARMLKSRFARVRGTVRFQGTEAVAPGSTVELSGMGDRFNGRSFVSGVRHTLGAGDWQTAVQIGLRPEWHAELYPVNPLPAGGLRPGINGLQPGVVTQLQDDPAGEDRILVRLPLISTSDDGVWSRVATLDAGNERGIIFRPEIGDEVIVGFINADPHHPVVLGMMNSSS
ncbi:MAG: type VI secretion system tip protein VgrG, partial [Planctomycetes bacterium]|nr:type VI secretion system tip protein VgrG [Planctomycetota bacterium]